MKSGLSRKCYELATKFKTEQKVSRMIEVGSKPLKRHATQKPEGSGSEESGQELDGMLVRMLEPDYGFLTGAITLGGLDPRDETFEQRGSQME